MRRRFSIISVFVLLLVLSASFVTAAQLVNIGAAKRAAEYHGESIFEKDLKVCDHELLHWAWGEPAVYVFTLMREGDVYPYNILRDSTLLKGAYLVSIGKKEAGYEKMAQADRYWTVYVGATTDMPSFLKAHAGLPEHIVTQPLMNNFPGDPYWIYGGPFHILVASRSQIGADDAKATEIHLKETFALKGLGREKSDTIPAYAEQAEWGLFFNAGADLKAADKWTTVLLKVKEFNLQGKWWGCSSAAFYNCLKYLEEKGKVRLYGKTASFLQEWISICYMARFDGKENYSTLPDDEVYGSGQVFRGLNYASKVTYTKRKPNPGKFFQLYVSEIKSGYPCALSRAEEKDTTNIFYKHVTTGIGYMYSGTHTRVCIHDGWAETASPLWYNYSGYPEDQLVYPQVMVAFRPGKSQKFPTATPVIEGPNIVVSSETSSSWTWEEKFTSPNKLPVELYTYENIFRDSEGTVYHRGKPPWDRIIPYRNTFRYNLLRKTHKTGTKETKYKLLDANGHLLVAKKTVELVIGDAYSGPFSGTLKSYVTVMPSFWIKDAIVITAVICLDGNGTMSDPYRGVFSFDGKDTQTSSITDGPAYFHVFGDGEVSGSNGQIVASAPLDGTLIEGLARDKDGAGYQGYLIKFEGTKTSSETITGTMTFDLIFEGYTTLPVVKTVVLTKEE